MKIICQHFWMAVLFNASSLRLEVNAYFGRSKTTSLKSFMTYDLLFSDTLHEKCLSGCKLAAA